MQLAGPVLIEHLSKLWNSEESEGEGSQAPEEFDADNLPLIALELVQFFPMVLDWKKLEELNALMLSYATVKIGEDSIDFDKDGFAELDPVESYNALLYAIVANYEPQIPPLLSALTKQGEDDTDQNQGTQANKI
jgi:hypothetical protein